MTGRCPTRSTTPACSRASGRPYRCWTAGTGGSSIGRSTKRTWTASWQTSRRHPKSRCTSRSPTKHGATPPPARESRRPSARPDERDEGARRSFPEVEASIGLPGCNDQHLSAPRADGGDDVRDKGRVVAGPCPDLEDSIAWREPGLFEHDCDHRRCGDGLASANREGDVFVRGVCVFRPYEQFPRHREERISHPRILDVPGADQSLHHP